VFRKVRDVKIDNEIGSAATPDFAPEFSPTRMAAVRLLFSGIEMLFSPLYQS
jgi:hypothetical protein